MILLFSIVSCTAGPNATQAIHSMSLFDTTWNLVEINQKVLNTSNAPKTPHLQFSKKEMKATGNNGCNSFFAGFASVEGRLTFGPVGSTRMACQKWIKNETAFMAMLQASQRYTVNGNILLIMDKRDQVVGKFIAAE